MKSQASEMWGFEQSLQCSFSKKLPIFKEGKNVKFALQHPIIFGALVWPWTILKAKKQKKISVFMGKKSVSGHLKSWCFD